MRGRGLAFVAGRNAGQRNAQQQQQATQAASSASSDQTAQLQQLEKMHKEGTLSDAEFAQAKKKVLNG